MWRLVNNGCNNNILVVISVGYIMAKVAPSLASNPGLPRSFFFTTVEKMAAKKTTVESLGSRLPRALVVQGYYLGYMQVFNCPRISLRIFFVFIATALGLGPAVYEFLTLRVLNYCMQTRNFL